MPSIESAPDTDRPSLRYLQTAIWALFITVSLSAFVSAIPEVWKSGLAGNAPYETAYIDGGLVLTKVGVEDRDDVAHWLKPGQQVVAIDGIPIVPDMKSSTLNRLIHGDPGSIHTWTMIASSGDRVVVQVPYEQVKLVRAIEQLGFKNEPGVALVYTLSLLFLQSFVFLVLGIGLGAVSTRSTSSLAISVWLVAIGLGTELQPDFHPEWVQTWMDICSLLVFVTVPYVILVMPSGSFMSRWTKLLATIWILLEVFLLHPIFLPWEDVLGTNWGPALQGGLRAMGAVAVLYRYLRWSTPVEQAAIRWMTGGIFSGILSLAAVKLHLFGDGAVQELYVAVVHPLIACVAALAVVNAVVRYRIWDFIDVWRNAVLVMVFSLLAVSATIGFNELFWMAPPMDRPEGADFHRWARLASLGLALCTAAALLFWIRRWVIRITDAAVFPRRSQATEAVTAGAGALLECRTVNEVAWCLNAIIRYGWRVERVTLWLAEAHNTWVQVRSHAGRPGVCTFGDPEIPPDLLNELRAGKWISLSNPSSLHGTPRISVMPILGRGELMGVVVVEPSLRAGDLSSAVRQGLESLLDPLAQTLERAHDEDKEARSDPQHLDRPNAVPIPSTEQALHLLSATALFQDVSDRGKEELNKAISWYHLDAGGVLHGPSTPVEHLVVVNHGAIELRSSTDDNATVIIARMGSTIGHAEIVSKQPFDTHAVAIRDTELAFIPKDFFLELAAREPQISWRLAEACVGQTGSVCEPVGTIAVSTSIAVVPLHNTVDDPELINDFVQAMHLLVATTQVERAHFEEIVGAASSDSGAEGKLQRDRAVMAWMSELAEQNRFLVFRADPEVTDWTLWCIRNADTTVYLADATQTATLTAIERALIGEGSRVPRGELILLHPANVEAPHHSRAWRDWRPWISVLRHQRRDDLNHLQHLARLYTARGVGLVLGGGGARGNAHLGVVRALRELGVPIDVVAGTSAGGGVAGMVAQRWDCDRMFATNTHAFQDMAPFSAYSPPYHSIMSKPRVDASAKWMFGDLDIEDLWLPFFCISCDILNTEKVIHDRGRLWKAVRATTALPGVLPPVVMGGRMLVDGGVVDNQPVAVMRARNIGPCILIKVSPPAESLVGDDVVELPTNSAVYQSLLHPFVEPRVVPTLASIVIQTMTLSSDLSEPEKLSDLCIAPDLRQYGMIDFESQNELVAIGYNAVMEAFEARANDADFLDLFGLTPADISDSLPRMEVPVWQSARRKLRAHHKRVLIQSLILFVVGALINLAYQTPGIDAVSWSRILVWGLIIGCIPIVRELFRLGHANNPSE